MGSMTMHPPSADHHRRLHNFVGMFQRAMTLTELSRAVVDGVDEVIPANKSAFYRLDGDSGNVLDIYSAADDWFLHEYEEYCRIEDPLLDYVRRRNKPIDSTRVMSSKQWKEAPNYLLLERAGLRHSLEAPVVASGVLLGTMNFARSEVAGEFSGADLTVASLMSEQLGFALERVARFELSGRRASLFENVLDRLPEAVIVTDLDGQVLFRNRAARRDPRLEAATPPVDDEPTLEALIAEAMRSFRLRGKRIHVGRLRGESGRERIVKSFRLGDSHGAAMTMVFDEGETAGSPTLPAWKVLTKREQEIARLVAEGLTAKEIAARAYITENTVKQHLKRLFVKTESRNRAELVQRIWVAGRAE